MLWGWTTVEGRNQSYGSVYMAELCRSKALHRAFSAAHMLPRQAHIFSMGKSVFFFLRCSARGARVLKCLSLFSWQSLQRVGVHSYRSTTGMHFNRWRF